MPKRLAIFRKKILPGPDSVEEKREQEVESMMTEWYEEEGSTTTLDIKEHSVLRFLISGFFILIVIVVLACGGLYWLVLGKPGPASPDQAETDHSLMLTIDGPAEINSGEELTLTINLQNTSRVRLTDLNLNLLYPDNFIFKSSLPEAPFNVKNNTWRLGALEPETSRKLQLSGQILGKTAARKDFEAVVVYQPINFHSNFKQVSSYSVTIKQSLLDVVLDIPDTLLPEQPLEFKVLVTNTADSALTAVRIGLEYPAAMSLTSSSIPLSDNGDAIINLAAKESREILLIGAFKGRPSEIVEFRAEVGLMSDGQFMLQNQAVKVAGVINPEVMWQLQSLAGQTKFHFGETLEVELALTNLSTIVFDSGTLDLAVSDPEDLLLWDDLAVLPLTNTTIIPATGTVSPILRLSNLPALGPGSEFKVQLSWGLISVPLDISAIDYSVSFTPKLVAESSDLSVPVNLAGEPVEFIIK